MTSKTSAKAALALMLLAISSISGTAIADDRKGNYAIWGVGASTCNQYNKARLAGEDQRYRGYISGYFTHYNKVTKQTVNIGGANNLLEILGMLDEMCSERPILSFNDAMFNLTQELHPDRQQHNNTVR